MINTINWYKTVIVSNQQHNPITNLTLFIMHKSKEMKQYNRFKSSRSHMI